MSGDGVRRVRIRVRGAVQGVGFRPFVYRLAREFGLGGHGFNDGEGVLIEVEGGTTAEFIHRLNEDAPPLARVDRIEVTDLPVIGTKTFEIIHSKAGKIKTAIPPDTAVCDDCLAELFDPQDRRQRYPFINCTNCGPRYTITRSLPYDRAQTSMAEFSLCADCAREYGDPADRRFHAEPNACPVCGPQLDRPIEDIVGWIRAGEIVALKGLGGFHLVCDAHSEVAVAELRRRKDREEKPFAVMVANLASAAALAWLDAVETRLLEAPERPIVLVAVRPDAGLAPSVAPRLDTVGLMLPSTPIQALLFHEAAGRPEGTGWLAAPQPLALVMTSANPGGEPLVTDDQEARDRLAGIADQIVGHDRKIVVRADDSVVRVVAGAPVFIRRARGFVPVPIKLPRTVPCVVGLGAHLKNTVCITRGDEAFLSQHIGDMDNAATIGFFEETIAHLTAILDVEPVAVAHDYHPDFFSTRYAESLGLPAIPVQHHHAHIAAVAAEYRVDEPLLGLALDGFGLGLGGGSWGGELLKIHRCGYQRIGHFRELMQPGGDKAAEEPWRMAAAALHALGRSEEIARLFGANPASEMVVMQLARGLNAPPTSSAGRLFDAAAGLLGISTRQAFEGQAPMLLEALVETPRVLEGGWRVADDGIDFLPLLEALIDREPKDGAELFHGTLVAGLADWLAAVAAETGCRSIALSGGCFLNRHLSEGLVDALARRGLMPLLPRLAPPGDGGISLGQAWIAGQAFEIA